MTENKIRQFLPTIVGHMVKHAEGGKTPSERELSEHLHLSRGLLRECLAVLEAVNIIERRPKSGIYLTLERAGLDSMVIMAEAGVSASRQQLHNALELRRIHDVNAAALAAERASEVNFEALRDILERSEERVAKRGGLNELDAEFHLEIVKATGNDLLYKICASFYSARGPRVEFFFRSPERNAASLQEHKAIYEALKSKDMLLSRAQMNAHLRSIESYWEEMFTWMGGSSDEVLPGYQET